MAENTLYHLHKGQAMEGGEHNPNIPGGTVGHDFFDNTVGLPTSKRYWKNIIPKDTLMSDREGINLDANIENGEVIINTYSEQDWLDGSYYPVLPKLNQSGKFIENNFPNNKIPFPKQGDITDENETNENLVINITSNEEDEGVLKDNSGNTNLGFAISKNKREFNNKY